MMQYSPDSALLALAQAFVDRKYVARADARQKSMGLAYVEAERQDLAREIIRFVQSLPDDDPLSDPDCSGGFIANARTPAQAASMTVASIESAFDEWCKSLTVVDRPSNQEIFSQGYVAGWNAKEDTAPQAVPCAHAPIIDMQGKFRCQKCWDVVEMAVAQSAQPQASQIVAWRWRLKGNTDWWTGETVPTAIAGNGNWKIEPLGVVQPQAEPCPKCDGEGFINRHANLPDEPCPACSAQPQGASREVLEQAKAALLKIRGCSIRGAEQGYSRPIEWADELFASHADVAVALKSIDAALSRPPRPTVEKTSGDQS